MTKNDVLWGSWMEKANIWLTEFQVKTGLADHRKAFVGLRGALHGLRDRLPVEEAVELAAQLPMLWKAVFFDGWVPVGKPVRVRREAPFLDLVRHHIGPDPQIDPRVCIRGLMAVLNEHVSRGEMEDVVHALPKEVTAIWQEGAHPA